jgi:hypothetical protein
MTVFAAELKKIIFNRYIFLIFALFIVQIIFCFVPKIYNHSYSVEVYKNYMQELGGDFTPEKETTIRQRLAEIEELKQNYDSYTEAYKQDKITLDEFDEINIKMNKAKAEETTLQYLAEKCDYYNSTGGYEKKFFYDTDWLDFLSHQNYNYLILLAVICIVVSVFDKEYSSDSISMILTTKYGYDKVYISKIIIVFLTAFLIAFLMYMTKYGIFSNRIGGSFQSENLGNLIGYDGYGDIKISEFYIIDTLIKSVSWAVSSVFICLISIFCKNSIFTIFISAVVLVIPSQNFGNYVFCAGNFTGMYSVNLNFILLFSVLFIKLIFYSAAGNLLWRKRG